MSPPPDDNKDTSEHNGYLKLKDIVEDFDNPGGLQPEQGTSATDNAFTSYIPVGEEYYSHNGTNQTNSFNIDNYAKPNVEPFTSGSHLNVPELYNYAEQQTRGTAILLTDLVNQSTAPLQQVSTQSTEGALQMRSYYSANTQNYVAYEEPFGGSAYSLPHVVNQSTAPIQQLSIQSTDRALQMNSDFSPNTQNYVQANNQQGQFVAPPSQISNHIYIALPNKSVLKVCKKEDFERGTGTVFLGSPMLQQAQDMHRISLHPLPIQVNPGTANVLLQSQTSNTLSSLPQNNINTANLNSPQSKPRPRNIKVLRKNEKTSNTMAGKTKTKPSPKIIFNIPIDRTKHRGVMSPPLSELYSAQLSESQVKEALLQSSEKTNSVVKVRTGEHTKPCNCTKSQCLKLYCECFTRGLFCQNCNCINCRNDMGHERLRSAAVKSCLKRNPNAFSAKIGKAESMHTKGCYCRRSGCLKKYCECYDANIQCTSKCKCVGCKNCSIEESVSKEVPMVTIEDAAEVIVETSDDGIPERKNKEDIKSVASFFTPRVREAIIESLFTKAGESAEESSKKDVISKVMTAFNDVMVDVTSAYNEIREENCEVKKSTRTEEENKL